MFAMGQYRYMLATSWKKFMNRLVKSGNIKPMEIFDTLIEALDTNPVLTSQWSCMMIMMTVMTIR